MTDIERMEAVNAAMSNPAIAAVIVILMVVIGIVFVFIYAAGQKTDNDIREAEERADKAVAEKEKELDKIRSAKKQLAADKFAALTEVKILRELLADARWQIEWEQYKNAQLMKGVFVSDEQRSTFDAERYSGTVKPVA